MSKPLVEIISPVGECSCSFSTWMNRVWDVLNEYGEEIKIVSIVSDEPRAKELGGRSRVVFINGEEIPVFNLDRKLRQLLNQK